MAHVTMIGGVDVYARFARVAFVVRSADVVERHEFCNLWYMLITCDGRGAFCPLSRAVFLANCPNTSEYETVGQRFLVEAGLQKHRWWRQILMHLASFLHL